MSTKPFRPTEPAPRGGEQTVAQRFGATTPEDKGSARWNFYRCDTCHHFFVTVDVDTGVTPFMLMCRDRVTSATDHLQRRSTCRGTMRSAFYPVPAKWPAIVPKEADGEWYAPPRSERLRLKRTNQPMFQHVRQGGLLLRPATRYHPFPETSHAASEGEAAS